MKAVQSLTQLATKRSGSVRFFQTSTVTSGVRRVQSPGDSAVRRVTVLPGHGIGPEIVRAAQRVVDATNAPIEWDVVDNIVDRLTPEAVESVSKNKVCLKGEFDIGVGRHSLPSINVGLRKRFDLYANVVHSFPLRSIKARHEDVNIVLIRESTEGEYSGMEHEVLPGVTESLKVMTRSATLRIAQYAFEYAYLNNRKTVTAVHKANIMKRSDGLFLESCREVAKEFPFIEYNEIIVDNCMMQLVSQPQQFDVMVTPNLYGSLVANVVAGLNGGPGVFPGCTVGKEHAVFEQGARHVGKDIAGLGVANPTGMMFASAMMLHHLRLHGFADRVDQAVTSVIEDRVALTPDLGGKASTDEFTEAVIDRLQMRCRGEHGNTWVPTVLQQ